jgi:hypothetical protein
MPEPVEVVVQVLVVFRACIPTLLEPGPELLLDPVRCVGADALEVLVGPAADVFGEVELSALEG